MLSKSIQSIVGIFVGFAIGGVLGLLATPPPPAPSVGEDGLVIAVEGVPAVPVELALTIAPGPTTTRPPRDDAILPRPPAAEEASTPAPTAKPKPTKPTATKTDSTVSASAPTQKPTPKPKPSSRPAPTPPRPPAPAPTPDPGVATPTPTPEPPAEKQPKGPKPKPDKPPKPPKPPKLA
jgi:hypothetical protein